MFQTQPTRTTSTVLSHLVRRRVTFRVPKVRFILSYHLISLHCMERRARDDRRVWQNLLQAVNNANIA
jgi:hypothetical protein